MRGERAPPFFPVIATETTDPHPTPGLWFPSPKLLLVFVLSVGDPHTGASLSSQIGR